MTLSPDVIDSLPHVEGVLNYLAPMAERPMNLAYDPPPGVPRSTGAPEPHRVMIYDARRIAARLSLDTEGLAVVKHNSAVRDFYDEDELRRVYYPRSRASRHRSHQRHPGTGIRPHGASSRLGRRRPVVWNAAPAGHS